MTLNEDTVRYLSSRRPNGKQKVFFDMHASEWDSINSNDPAKLAYLVGLLDIRGDESIADIGTGTGVMIPSYLGSLDSGHVAAVDFSERMIEQAMRKHPPSERLSYLVSDVCGLPPSGEFDLAVCYSCFPHFPDPVEALRSLSGILRTGGRLAILHSSSKDFINNVHRNGGECISNDFLPEIDVMADLFRECGLEMLFSRDDSDYYIAIGRKCGAIGGCAGTPVRRDIRRQPSAMFLESITRVRLSPPRTPVRFLTGRLEGRARIRFGRGAAFSVLQRGSR